MQFPTFSRRSKFAVKLWTPLVAALAAFSWSAGCAQGDEAAQSTSDSAPALLTRWAKEVSADNALPEYPRPQMTRAAWTNLNGLWEYAVRPQDEPQPEAFDGQILVPFPIESALSQVQRQVGPENRLWYRRSFQANRPGKNERLLLHFGAVDWHAIVWVNGAKIGEHRGGYDPFSFDISDALREGDRQEIVVSVWDPSDTGSQPRGKQVRQPRGIWYTPVTGIWQTVWLEPVPAAHVASLKITPDVDQSSVVVQVEAANAAGDHVATIEALDGERVIGSVRAKPGEAARLAIASPKLWSPESPHLYGLRVSLGADADAAGDVVESYFAMRKIAFQRDERGVNRLFLNNKPLFQFGPLDQGWWPDGLYTAPTDEALRYDIEMTRKLGFNMCRKHVKVEPARWYYWADKLGLLVWQDMPSGFIAGDRSQQLRRGQPSDARFTEEQKAVFRRELQAMIDSLRNHPSIVVWVPFNEGWGQHDTNEILRWVKSHDPTRLVCGPSGWEDRGEGDLKDMHRYPGPDMFPPEPDRVSVLGEFGGLGLPLEGHTWLTKDNWGYRNYTTKQELAAAYADLIRQLPSLIADGLAAAVYTQTTDVEIEVNGLLTYDRAVVKIDPEQLVRLHRPLYQPPARKVTIVPTSRETAQSWAFTTTDPGAGWMAPDYDVSSWRRGPGGLGTQETPNTTVRTVWNTPDIWARREFDLSDANLASPHLEIYHDEDAEVYLNGELVAKVTGYVTNYRLFPLDAGAQQLLKSGKNILAVHCRQTGGGQYIDVGLVDLRP